MTPAGPLISVRCSPRSLGKAAGRAAEIFGPVAFARAGRAAGRLGGAFGAASAGEAAGKRGGRQAELGLRGGAFGHGMACRIAFNINKQEIPHPLQVEG